ncbi:MAG: YdiU family protein [Pseudomonadota bacterium]
MSLALPFDNSYARLPERFFTRQDPTPVPKPSILLFNDDLASELGLSELNSDAGTEILAGNTLPAGAEPVAQVYAGQQFGNWVPQLGDGRAILLGEVIAGEARFDIQLKGSGPTPYSRNGDGRAWLGPILREYIVSEAMHALGVPTTRALAAVATGATVLREAPFPGAVLTRIAPSHIRVGTFQYFAAQRDTDALQALMEHVIARHYPDCDGPLDLLDAVVTRQADLIAHWMSLGFIHGVMNTDNAHVAGITIDYGPCAFMDTYHPGRVFSSIDQFGRYAYNRQPEIGGWNMAQFATALLPLMGEQDAAVEAATEVVNRFAPRFQAAYMARFRAKVGLTTEEPEDIDLLTGLLSAMAQGQADFTNTFRALVEGQARDQFLEPAAFDDWEVTWRARLAREPGDPDAVMQAANPALIPRNHRIEEAIQAALTGNLDPARRLVEALDSPFVPPAGTEDLRRPPTDQEQVHQTFCGT